jgi:hypothetical protein
MKTLNYLILSFLLFCSTFAFAQNVLPDISVNNLNKKVIVSWLNEYKKPIQNIFIQRSYDSLKNFSTIGTVLNPLNLENGYPDLTPPYDRMFYRVTITFENGEYEIGKSARPFIEPIQLEDFDITAVPKKVINNEIAENSLKGIFDTDRSIKTDLKKSIETSFPSSHIYSNKQNMVVINLQKTAIKKYSIKFFDEKEKQIFEIKHIPDDYLFIEKSNFIHPGWFYFELYEDGVLIEKNKVFLAKDKVKNN